MFRFVALILHLSRNNKLYCSDSDGQQCMLGQHLIYSELIDLHYMWNQRPWSPSGLISTTSEQSSSLGTRFRSSTPSPP